MKKIPTPKGSFEVGTGMGDKRRVYTFSAATGNDANTKRKVIKLGGGIPLPFSECLICDKELVEGEKITLSFFDGKGEERGWVTAPVEYIKII